MSASSLFSRLPACGENTSGKPSRACFFHCAILVGWTPFSAAISLAVFCPLMASKATLVFRSALSLVSSFSPVSRYSYFILATCPVSWYHYNTNATNIAAQRMNEIGKELVQGWHQFDGETIKRPLGELISAARYIAEAARYQQGSNKKLGTAIKVTMQVSEQLAVGATSAHAAANQLQEVVEQLQDVVGV